MRLLCANNTFIPLRLVSPSDISMQIVTIYFYITFCTLNLQWHGFTISLDHISINYIHAYIHDILLLNCATQ